MAAAGGDGVSWVGVVLGWGEGWGRANATATYAIAHPIECSPSMPMSGSLLREKSIGVLGLHVFVFLSYLKDTSPPHLHPLRPDPDSHTCLLPTVLAACIMAVVSEQHAHYGAALGCGCGVEVF